MSTGIRRRRVAALAVLAVLLAAPGPGRAQTFKLSALRLPPDIPAGSWVAYQIDLTAKNRPPRRITQRIAVVSREGKGPEAGAWVEMKTTEGERTRTERGYYMRPEGKPDLLDSLFADEDPTAAPGSDGPAEVSPLQKLHLTRYQKLTPDGKLYEYPMDDESASLPEEDLSAIDLFEFSRAATSDTLGVDTLRVGRRVIPCRVRWVRRYGSQEWEGQDSTYVNRALMTQKLWKNRWIPVTGLARETIEVSSVRIPVPTAAAADSSGTPPPAASEPATSEFFYGATISLLDLGKDAVPEITQASEPAPRETLPKPRILER